MMNNPLLRRVRHAFATTQAADDAKVTDNTITTAYELEKSITVTPAANQYIIITSINMDIAMDKIIGLGTTVTGGTKIVGLDANPVDTVSRFLSAGTAATDCTNNNYTSGTRTQEYIGSPGTAITVEFYLKSDQATSPTSYCTANNRINYKLVTLVKHGKAGAC